MMRVHRVNTFMISLFLIPVIAVSSSGCSSKSNASGSKGYSSASISAHNNAKQESTTDTLMKSSSIQNTVTPQPNPTNEPNQTSVSPLPAKGKKISSPATSLQSPLEINPLDEITSTLEKTQFEQVDCYSIKVKEKTKLNIYIKYDEYCPDCHMFTSENFKKLTYQNYLSRRIDTTVDSANIMTREIIAENIYEKAYIYELDQGEYFIGISKYLEDLLPIKYELVTFLGDSSNNPWKGEYTITADRSTGLGFSKSSGGSADSSNYSNFNASKFLEEQRRKDEEEDARRRERERQRDNHPNLKK